jgi:3-keto-disaccharide hydrolase
MRHAALIVLGLGLLAGAGLTLSSAGEKRGDEGGYIRLFDGKSLDGWHVSAKSGHSKTSGNKSGGKWVVEDGAIVGSQDMPKNGGIVLTDKKFKDFEVIVEMKNDFGPDSGVFLRSTEDGKAYQAMIDYHAGGNVMGVYGEGIGGFHFRNYSFEDTPDKITPEKDPKKMHTPLPVAPEKWADFWKHGQWNEFKARIVGNPPTVTTWINGVKFMEWTDEKKRLPDEGAIALQVHGGGDSKDYDGKFVRYRNIRVKELGGSAAK